MGFLGKWAIHPSQVEIANAAFSPTADEIAPDHLTNPILCRPMALSTERRLSPSGTLREHRTAAAGNAVLATLGHRPRETLR